MSSFGGADACILLFLFGLSHSIAFETQVLSLGLWAVPLLGIAFVEEKCVQFPGQVWRHFICFQRAIKWGRLSARPPVIEPSWLCLASSLCRFVSMAATLSVFSGLLIVEYAVSLAWGKHSLLVALSAWSARWLHISVRLAMRPSLATRNCFPDSITSLVQAAIWRARAHYANKRAHGPQWRPPRMASNCRHSYCCLAAKTRSAQLLLLALSTNSLANSGDYVVDVTRNGKLFYSLISILVIRARESEREGEGRGLCGRVCNCVGVLRPFSICKLSRI